MKNKKKEKPVVVQPVLIFMFSIIMTTVALIACDNMNLSALPDNWIKNISFDELGMLVAMAIMFSLIMETKQSKRH